jgi:hypothetical protein
LETKQEKEKVDEWGLRSKLQVANYEIKLQQNYNAPVKE